MTRTSPTRTAGPDDERLRAGDMRSSSRTTGARLFHAADRTAEDGPVACVSSGFVPSGGAEHKAGLYTAVGAAGKRMERSCLVAVSAVAAILHVAATPPDGPRKRKAWTSNPGLSRE